MAGNVLPQLLTPHLSPSDKNWPRKIDFSIFRILTVRGGQELIFGGRNFKNAYYGQGVQKSRKYRFRDNTFLTVFIGQRNVSDTWNNGQRSGKGRIMNFCELRFWL